MLNLATGMQHKYRAFTLIEILVVIVIIGIMIGFSLLSFGDFGANRQAKMSAEHFVAYLQLMQHKAILEDRTLALLIDPQSYTPLVLADDEKWLTLKASSVLKEQKLPKRISIHYKAMSNNLTRNAMIIIHPSGDIEPFTMHFGTKTSFSLIRVKGTHDGKINIYE